MQYTNASIFMGKLFYDFVFVPTEGVHVQLDGSNTGRGGVCEHVHVYMCITTVSVLLLNY